MKILWFSCGAASAVACKIALKQYPDARIVYQKIWSAHEDNERFIADCEKWYGKKIEVIHSMFYKDQFDVIERVKYINGPSGAPCTTHLKRNVRKQFEAENKGITRQVFGMSFEEKHRAERLLKQHDNMFEFPLIDNKVDKKQCYQILMSAGIELPMMYRLGFNNNNCRACVKGGKGYWNQIKKHFPVEFDKMVALEEMIGHSCIRGCFLKDLKPEMGRHKEPDLSCDLPCQSGEYDKY